MRFRLLGKSGLRVSELCLGTMTFGETWGWGASQEESRRIFDAFAKAGGNFIDTSNNYTDGTSERYVGEFVASERDYFVVATKYTLSEGRNNPNAGGNQRKNMMRSVEGSLKRLNMDVIDLLYLHMWDETTPVEEVLRAADDLVRAGKVHYFAFSDTPAWVVSYATAIADRHGWTRPVAIQLPYSVIDRSPENEIVPMAHGLDLTVMAWGILGGGVLTGKYNQPSDEAKRYDGASDREKGFATQIGELAQACGRTPVQLAVNWVRQQPGKVIPILGARSEAQLHDQLGALDFTLTPEQMAALDALAGFKLGFPNNFLHSDHVRGLIFGETFAQLEPRT